MLSGCAMLRLPLLYVLREKRLDAWMLITYVKAGSSVSVVNEFWWLAVAELSCVGVEVSLSPFESKEGILHLEKERREEWARWWRRLVGSVDIVVCVFYLWSRSIYSN